MNTYFSLVPDDVWDYMLMNEAPLDMAVVRRNCLYLKEQSLKLIFQRNYLERWQETMIQQPFYYGFVLCRSDRWFLTLREGRSAAITLSLTTAYDLEDLDSVDWILEKFGCQQIRKQPVPYQRSLITRIIERGASPAELCQNQSESITQLIQEMYPQADYTAWIVALIPVDYLMRIIQYLKREIKYDPQVILWQAIDLDKILICQYLLATYSFSDEIRYLMSTQTSNREVLRLLVNPFVVEKAIQAQDLALVFQVLAGELPGDLSSLYSIQHSSFLRRLLQLNLCRPLHLRLSSDLIQRLQQFV